MITIVNFTSKEIDEEYLRGVVQKVLEEEGKKGYSLAVVLVGRGRMKELNRKYRKKNRVTDVLSFSGEVPSDFVIPSQEKELGEIVLCLPVIKKNAKRMGTTFKRELTLSLIHGILHLLGYEHEKSPALAKKMEERQQYYLNQFVK